VLGVFGIGGRLETAVGGPGVEVSHGVHDAAAELAKARAAADHALLFQRLEQRTQYDIEMIVELGYCNGIENYSRYLSGRAPGEPPPTLLEYFPKDFLCIIDESHVTVPQIGGMYRGDRARKLTLVEHGFRLPSALDNRPLNFQEFESLMSKVCYVSATPGPYELQKSNGLVIEQIIRPMTRASAFRIMSAMVETEKTSTMISFVEGDIEVYIDIGDAVDPEKEKARLEKELAEAEKYVQVLENKLSNQDFVARAPAAVIDGERAKLATAAEKIVKTRAALESLSK
jgi:hypothetical protein